MQNCSKSNINRDTGDFLHLGVLIKPLAMSDFNFFVFLFQSYVYWHIKLDMFNYPWMSIPISDDCERSCDMVQPAKGKAIMEHEQI